MTPSKKAKRFELTRRIIVYTVMVSAVTASTVILVFLMLGYRFNQASGEIQQGGLVQFITQPSGARVTVGTAKLANTTRSKITLNPGSYPVTMERDGYVPWKKDITVKPGAVLWLNSARLIPQNLVTETVYAPDAVDSAIMRTSGKEIAIIEDETKLTLTLVTMNNDRTQTRTISLAKEFFGKDVSSKCALDRWFESNRRLLMKCTVSNQTRWVVVDVERPQDSKLLPTHNGEAAIIDIQLDPTSSERLYVLYGDGTIVRLRVTDLHQESTNITDAQSFELTSTGIILYASKASGAFTIVGYADGIDSEPQALEVLSATDPVEVTGGMYFDDFYVAVAVNDTVTLSRYAQLPVNDEVVTPEVVTTFTIEAPVRDLKMRAGNRFVSAQTKDEFVVYDSELDALHRTDISTSSAKGWIDNYHVAIVRDGALYQYEFDGTNQTKIADALAGYRPAYSDNNEYLYSIGTDDNKKIVVQRTKILLD